MNISDRSRTQSVNTNSTVFKNSLDQTKIQGLLTKMLWMMLLLRTKKSRRNPNCSFL